MVESDALKWVHMVLQERTAPLYYKKDMFNKIGTIRSFLKGYRSKPEYTLKEPI